ncbi:uncharacterized protein MYCFIDRAFT_172586 [Pseudocercospora fijiensis CIRAD86]|uniref:PH domain-containing protein n=1 Tax=Pseudocercospora fijiensis (strain CIRAD86) TaxID=383855 RepID=M3BC83_PSEFD|nr:uncharacterized protein MYCFIDRAFT_172586 [Pseudocercospora fijiensis CIRAD86]EME86892.1 hypothetical protein MYCFIDRAFT_172586 [Pseudocercospora fijiensis CIRAD86]
MAPVKQNITTVWHHSPTLPSPPLDLALPSPVDTSAPPPLHSAADHSSSAHAIAAVCDLPKQKDRASSLDAPLNNNLRTCCTTVQAHMDAPDETHLESAADAGLDDRNQLPQLSRSATTLDAAAQSSTAHPVSSPVAAPALKPRKTLRTRPSHQALERQHAAPSSLNHRQPPPPDQQSRPRLTNMSLFNLFSKPKVERQRGYAEPSLERPSRTLSKSDPSHRRPEVVSRAREFDALPTRPRPTSSKSYAGRTARTASIKQSVPPLPIERKARHFDPPPLFQVWPQTTKHGTFEMTTVTPEMVLQKSRIRMVGTALLVPAPDMQSLQSAGNRGSFESRVTVKSSLKHVANGSISGVHLPSKIFVLVTSGYLLQYAETGPSDRLPEKVLQLGRHSAAYASDLIPGKYHVLHVEHAVDQNGTAMPHPNSFFSKIGLRSQVAKKMASNFLIVMPGAREMEDWMTTIREEIEKHGGKRARSDSSTARPRTTEPPKIDLQRTPSLSHRYQIKRESMIFNITSLTEDVMKELPPTPPIPTPEEKHLIMSNPEEEAQASSDIETIPPLARKVSDAMSTNSSTGVSIDQQKLDTLRDSSRISHSTVATTAGSSVSRTNSISSTPPSEGKEVHEIQAETAAAKGPYRTLSSYALPKRRSAAPLVLPDPAVLEADTSVDSPLLGRQPTHVAATLWPSKNLSPAARSVPNLNLIGETTYSSALPMPPTAEVVERPESFVGDLPDPTTWASKCSPTSRGQSQADPFGRTRPLRAGSQSFSLPLRVNVQDQSLQRPVINRASRSAGAEGALLSPVPAATTLVAKVDATTRTVVDYHDFPHNPSPPPSRPLPAPPTTSQGAPENVQRNQSVRLSLFPSGAVPAPISGPVPLKRVTRSPSATALNTRAAHSTADAGALKRPSSMQVRTSFAPFLSSVRASPTSPVNENERSTTTVPIRSLKPSRSVATMQTVHQRTVMKTESFNFSTRRVLEEEAEQATPLPTRSSSPPKDSYSISRPSSRTRGPRASASLPELDFGIPVVGLGPPAPPPQTPLPEIPTHSRPASRTEGPILRTGTPIGVAIGDIEEEGRNVGLGIEVS